MEKPTREQVKLIQKLTRRANRRIERATGGQRRVLEYYARTGNKPGKFSAATKGMSNQQAQAQIEKLEKFLGSMSTTKIGWEWIKKEIVHKTGETLRGKMGYSLTDEEIADVLRQLEAAGNVDFYRAINLVEAKKVELGEELDAYQISEVIMQKASAQQALEEAISARKQRAVQQKRERVKLSLGVQKGKNPRKK